MPLSPHRLGKAIRPERTRSSSKVRRPALRHVPARWASETAYVPPLRALPGVLFEAMRECMERSVNMPCRNHLSRLAFAIAAVCASTAGLAQDELEETIVTATRTPVKLDALDMPVIVITRQDIERSLASD